MKILIDMDGVITDFMMSVCFAFGIEKDVLLKEWDVEEYEMKPILRKIKQKNYTDEEMWDVINNYDIDYGFWEGMVELPWTDDLIKLAEEYGEWFICTSPSRDPGCLSGKMKWLQNKFGVGFRNFIFTPHKYLLAGADTVLIDDSPAQIDKFWKAGGYSIPFLRCWNRSCKTEHDNPLQYIRTCLEQKGIMRRNVR